MPALGSGGLLLLESAHSLHSVSLSGHVAAEVPLLQHQGRALLADAPHAPLLLAAAAQLQNCQPPPLLPPWQAPGPHVLMSAVQAPRLRP